MDAETENHIDEARRPPEKKPMRRGVAGAGGVVANTDLPSDVLDPAVRLHEMRQARTRERLGEKLDRLVPMEAVHVENATVADVDAEGEVVLEEHFTGTVYRIQTKCLSCKEQMVLDTLEEPRLQARSVAAGILRRAHGSFRCDRCIAEQEAAVTRAEQEEAMRGRVATSQLDSTMQGFEFSDMRVAEGRDQTVNAARAWSVEKFPAPKRGLCIFGPKGSGKTRLAATATWQRLRRWPIVWVSWPILQAQLGAAFSDKARANALSVLTGKGALAIDDIAQDPDERVSDWTQRQLFAAVDRRIQAGAPLLITTNLGPRQIGDVLGEKLMSRITGYCKVMELPGEDMRLTMTFDGSETLQAANERVEAEAAMHGLQDPEERE